MKHFLEGILGAVITVVVWYTIDHLIFHDPRNSTYYIAVAMAYMAGHGFWKTA